MGNQKWSCDLPFLPDTEDVNNRWDNGVNKNVDAKWYQLIMNHYTDSKDAGNSESMQAHVIKGVIKIILAKSKTLIEITLNYIQYKHKNTKRDIIKLFHIEICRKIKIN